jgi:hypothetical protein
MSEKSQGPVPGGAVTDHETLRQMLAREAMQKGRMPDRPTDRMWGGTGRGETCSICSLVVTPQDLGYELEFAGDGQDVALHFLHGPCFTAWETELRNGKFAGSGRALDEKKIENAQLDGHKHRPEP